MSCSYFFAFPVLRVCLSFQLLPFQDALFSGKGALSGRAGKFVKEGFQGEQGNCSIRTFWRKRKLVNESFWWRGEKSFSR
ncbi:hypothetical protein EO95_13810 [Methanosarcina sp. 1.H.T.1A.1]|nr:hypothetical protein EO95_13810 [Methanosarcina sp. 1.H.T.1A.1]